MTTNTGIVGNREVDLISLNFTPSGSSNGDVLKTLIDMNPDAILIDTSGFMPFETRRANEYQPGQNNRTPLEILLGAEERGVPIFFLKELCISGEKNWGRVSGSKSQRATTFFIFMSWNQSGIG